MSDQPVTVDVSRDMRWDDATKKTLHESLPYYVPGFRSAVFEGHTIRVFCDADADARIEIAKVVQELATKISRNFRDVAERTVFSSDGAPNMTGVDPYLVLTENGSLMPTGRGKFAFSGVFTRLFKAVDRLLEDYCVKEGAQVELYPNTIMTESLLASGYLRLSPQLAYFVAPAHLDRMALTCMSEPTIVEEAHRGQTVANLGVPDQVLAPTVCYHCFEARRYGTINSLTVTALNKCHRHEAVNVASLQRLTTFWMRELIFFGDAPTVAKGLDRAVEFTRDLLTRWGVWLEIKTANDPFFADLGSGNRIFQAAFDLKRELRLPAFNGDSMAVASFNNHQTALVSKFSIRGSGELHSGCVGWGYERLLYGLLCQFGCDLDSWPHAVRTELSL